MFLYPFYVPECTMFQSALIKADVIFLACIGSFYIFSPFLTLMFRLMFFYANDHKADFSSFEVWTHCCFLVDDVSI